MKILKLRHIGIVVSDIEKTIYIFKNLFGLKIKSKIIKSSGSFISKLLGFREVEIKTSILKIEDNNRIELIQYKKPKALKKKIAPNNLGVSHFAVTIPSMQKFIKKAKRFKIKFVCKPILNIDKSAKVAYLKINNEIICEVVEVLRQKAKYSGGK